jgi:hypothetical protein
MSCCTLNLGMRPEFVSTYMSSAYSFEARITSCMYEPAHACTQQYGTEDHVNMYITLMNNARYGKRR